MKFLTILLFLLALYVPVSATTWYVRPSGSTAINCTGLANVDYDGAGTGESCAFASIQVAADAAALGDDIVVLANNTYTGALYLRDKGAGTDYITIKSSAQAFFLANVRALPADVASMWKLTGDGSGIGGGTFQGVITTAPSAHHWRIQGGEITPSSSSSTVQSVVLLESPGQGPGVTGTLPHHIIIDHCYIHSAGASDTSVVRGIALNSSTSEVTNSYISDIHGAGTDAQAIFAWNGLGPLVIDNNYLEATSECLQIGYGDPSLSPDDVTITRNYLSRPLAWMGPGGSGGLTNYGNVKNLFEMKAGTNVYFGGNVLDNNWADGQAGHAVNFGGFYNPIDDVIMENNLIRHVGAGFNLFGVPANGGYCHNVIVRNNLIYDLDVEAYDNPFNGDNSAGYSVRVGKSDFITVDHNTFVEGGSIVCENNDYTLAPNYTFTNNIAGAPFNSIDQILGIFNNGGAAHKNVQPWNVAGHGTLDQVFGFEEGSPTGPEPSYPQVSLYNSLNGSVWWFCNDGATTGQEGYVSAANQNYALDSGSLYKAQGDGGTDPGVNLNALSAAIGASSNNYSTATFKAVTGNWTATGATSTRGLIGVQGRIGVRSTP